MTHALAINPFYAARHERPTPAPQPERREVPERPVYAKLPAAPVTGSPVPHLTSLYHFDDEGQHRDARYAGNCGGRLIHDLLTFFRAKSVFDPMTGGGTCRRVCEQLGIYCWSSDLREGLDACDGAQYPRGCFDFCWVHPPYWRIKLYCDDPRDLSRTPTLESFLGRYRLLLANCAGSLQPGGKLAVLMGNVMDRQEGYVPLVYHTQRLCFELGLRAHCTDIVRFSHGQSSARKSYSAAFIPMLHDVCMVFEKGE